MKGKVLRVDAGEEPQGFNVRCERCGKLPADSIRKALVECATLAQVALGLVEDLNLHTCPPRSRAFTSSQS